MDWFSIDSFCRLHVQEDGTCVFTAGSQGLVVEFTRSINVN